MLSKKLKDLRTASNLTQSDFASKIDVARTTYAMYEQGHREPDYETIKKIADYYNVTTDFLLGRLITDSQQISNKEETYTFHNDQDIEQWYRELPNTKIHDLRILRQLWEIIRSDKNND